MIKLFHTILSAYRMCPVTPIELVSMYDTEVGCDGQLYIAQYIGGVLSWVCMDGGASFQEKSTKSNKSKSARRSNANKYPSVPLELVTEHEVYSGEDGNSYIARMVKGRMSWSLHTQTHDWNSTTITFITVNNDDIHSCTGKSNNSTGNKKTRKRSSKTA